MSANNRPPFSVSSYQVRRRDTIARNMSLKMYAQLV